jgi:DNA-binding response OmpR family regulator
MTEPLALVIEDDIDASIIFSKALEAAGFSTEIIRAGDVAVKKLKEVVPILIVLDLHLPNVVGTDILEQIREDDRLKETMVILATADPRMADVVREKADLVLLKPVTFSQVRDFSLRLLRRYESRRPPSPTPPAIVPA